MKYNMLRKVVAMSASLTLSPFLLSPSENKSDSSVASAAPQLFAVEFPELKAGQFAVISTDISDSAPTALGYLDSENGESQVWIFDSFAEARAAAIESVVASPNRECTIFDASRRLVHTLRNGQPIPLEVLLASRAKSPKGWWQIWK